MRMNRIVGIAVTAVVVIAAACAVPAAKAAPKASTAETAIQAAARQNRYALVTFYKKNDSASTKMLAEAKKLHAKYSSRANFVSADVGNAVHQELISRYGADRSPVPLTLVIAPNGAVTAGYPNEIKKTDISDAFVSSGMAEVLKVLQSGKLAAVCLQNSKTKHNRESLAAAEGLNTQAQLRGAVEVVKIDPSDRSEAKFIQTCKADAGSDSAQIVIIAPPGRVVGKFDGTATADSMTATLMKSLGGGCGGGSCGPGGCSPK
ncbi:MAG: hypothetical protein M1133_05690 [Armatimonadetes bacterium]|nr:hypothetical protein [Armatimonadota bacterium]